MTWRLYHCNSEIRAQLNYLIKIYLYLYNPVFYLLNGPDWYPLNMLDLLVLTEKFYIMFNMNFTKDFLCEIIERNESKSIIVVNFFYCRIIIQNDSFDCHGVCMNECEIAYLIRC